MKRIRFQALNPRLVTLRLGLLTVLACAPAPQGEQVPRSTLFIGVDISGSFEQDGRYDDAMTFAAHYIHAHLNGHGGLERPRALFVGAIGGEQPGQPQAFHPIHDFQGKDVEEIEGDLREWFQPDDLLTDFNAFFGRAATLVQRQNLALAPITLVLLTDGLPDVGPRDPDAAPVERYRAIDLDPLEYLARNVTVRVLYPDPTVAVLWEQGVPRSRVRMWTVDAVVMEGWRAQLAFHDPTAPDAPAATGPDPDPAMASVLPELPADDAAGGADAAAHAPSGPDSGAGPATDAAVQDGGEPRLTADQPALWRWIKDNVDFRVRRSVF